MFRDLWRRRWPVVGAVLLLIVLGVNELTGTQSKSGTFSYARLYADKNGISHFEEPVSRAQNASCEAS